MRKQTHRETSPRFHQVAATSTEISTWECKSVFQRTAKTYIAFVSGFPQHHYFFIARLYMYVDKITTQMSTPWLWPTLKPTPELVCALPDTISWTLPLTCLLNPQCLPSKLPKQTKFFAGSGPWPLASSCLFLQLIHTASSHTSN